MAPRLQGELGPDGGLALSIWGAGEVGRLRLGGLAGPLVIAPNRIEFGGLTDATFRMIPLIEAGRNADWPF